MSESDIQNIIIDIFETAYLLKLKEDALCGVFLALSEMVIKNKVSNQDFRHKLGGYIPGVMNILAETIGVEIKELDKMITNSDVISCSVLPDFISKLSEMVYFKNE